MKNLMIGASTLALAAVSAANVSAAEWDVRVGGYYNAMVAYATTDGSLSFYIDGDLEGRENLDADYDGVDVSTNAEVFFLPSIVLDNGIKIGANIQLEGETSGDQIDESYVYIKGSFGEILIGSENSAGYKMTYAAPNAAIISFNSPSTSDYIAWSGLTAGPVPPFSPFRSTLGTTYLEVNGNNDAKRISYFTPRFAGFQIGVSYARDGNQDNWGPTDLSQGSGNLGHIFDIGANYVQSFGDFNVALSGRFGIGQQEEGEGEFDSDESTPTVWSVGANFGYGGFTVGGSYAQADEHLFSVLDGEAYDLGISYATGPWTFSLTWFHGELGASMSEGDEYIKLASEQDTIGFGVDYKLAKGVRLNLFGAYVDADLDFTFADQEGSERLNVSADGWVIGTGIGLSW